METNSTKPGVPILTLLLLTTLALTGCASIGNQARKIQSSATGGHYLITSYSGGEPVRQWELHGHIDAESKTDGWNFNCNGMVRLSGGPVIEPFDQANKEDILEDRIVCN